MVCCHSSFRGPHNYYWDPKLLSPYLLKSTSMAPNSSLAWRTLLVKESDIQMVGRREGGFFEMVCKQGGINVADSKQSSWTCWQSRVLVSILCQQGTRNKLLYVTVLTTQRNFIDCGMFNGSETEIESLTSGLLWIFIVICGSDL